MPSPGPSRRARRARCWRGLRAFGCEPAGPAGPSRRRVSRDRPAGLQGRGATAPDQLAFSSASASTTAPADLALFTGTGTIGLPCRAVGRSTTSDTAGNVIHGVSTRAAAQVTVVYTYEVVVPTTPATWGGVKTMYR